MARRPVERRLAAILSADVEGYSRLMGDDEVATVRTITAYREVIATLVERHGGRVVDAPGDNVLAEFGSVVDAVRGAVEIQRELASRNDALAPARRMQFRIGINLGDVIVEGPRLYGDGVNIAARLEALAEGGGICLSGTAYDQVEGKLPLGYEFIGEHSVKNIARPVRVYRVRFGAGVAPGLSTPAPRGRLRRVTARVAAGAVLLVLFGVVAWVGRGWLGGSTRAALPLPDRPSIAVLPFANLSRDPAQEYFSDGVTEDLITGLSKVSGLFVIARNSVFTYKGKAVNVGEVGRDLGVRYVLEGGVQRAGDRVRITAQLVDASTGYHIWAERYDREVRDVFALQDEVTQKIIAALAVELTAAEQGRIGRAPTGNAEAYDLVLRGQDARRRATREGNAEARRLFVKALDLDPEYAQAYVGLSWAHLQSWQFLWTTGPESLERARALAERAIVLDDTSIEAHSLLGQIHLWRKEHDRALVQAERAVGLGPGHADGYETLAEVLAWAGRAEESLTAIRHAMRLNPHYPYYLWTYGHAAYLLERHQDALDAFNRLEQLNPDFLPAHAYLAVVLLEMGREEEAREAWRRAGELSPEASPASLRDRLPYLRPADLERFLAAVHRLRALDATDVPRRPQARVPGQERGAGGRESRIARPLPSRRAPRARLVRQAGAWSGNDQRVAPEGCVVEPAGGGEVGEVVVELPPEGVDAGVDVEPPLGGVVGDADGAVAGRSLVRSAGASVQAAAVMASSARELSPRSAFRIGDLREGSAETAACDAPASNGLRVRLSSVDIPVRQAVVVQARCQRCALRGLHSFADFADT